MREEELVYAAYVAFCLREIIHKDTIESLFISADEMNNLFDNLQTMVEIAVIAHCHKFKYKGEKIDVEKMYDDGWEDAWNLYKERMKKNEI